MAKSERFRRFCLDIVVDNKLSTIYGILVYSR